MPRCALVAVQRRCDVRNHRPAGTARCDRRIVRQRDLGQSARFRRHPSGHDHSSGRARRGAGAGAGAGAGIFGAGRSHGVHSRRGGRMPHRQCGLAGTLRARLAHHLDLRRVRCGRGLRQTAGAVGGWIANAIGIAASQSAGIVENLPSAAKNVSVGNAARNGLFAALLAAEGLRASPRAIEGPLGWARAMGDEPDLARLTGGSARPGRSPRTPTSPIPRASCFMRSSTPASICGEAEPAHRRYHINHGAGLGAAAGARRPAGSQRARCAGQHSSLRRLRAAAGRSRRSRIRGRDRISARHRVLAPKGEGGARCIASGWCGACHHPADVGRDAQRDRDGAKGSLADPLSDRDIEAKLRDGARLGGTDWISTASSTMSGALMRLQTYRA
jgi:hypothetical protein